VLSMESSTQSAPEKKIELERRYFLPVTQLLSKEVKLYFQNLYGWILIALAAIVAGLIAFIFMKKFPVSNQSLQKIFWLFSGITMILSFFLSMRLFAEEAARGTLELLITAPISEGQLVLGKFFSAMICLFVWILVTLPIPSMVLIFGDGHWGQLVSGYLGVILIGGASVAVTLFYSTLTKIQIVAGLLGAANVVFFLLLGFFSPYVSMPMKLVMREFSFYVHYMDFEKGLVMLKHIVFFFSIIALYLYLSVVSLQSKRWI